MNNCVSPYTGLLRRDGSWIQMQEEVAPSRVARLTARLFSVHMQLRLIHMKKDDLLHFRDNIISQKDFVMAS